MINRKFLFVKKFAKKYFGDVDNWLRHDIVPQIEAKLGEKVKEPPSIAEVVNQLDKEISDGPQENVPTAPPNPDLDIKEGDIGVDLGAGQSQTVEQTVPSEPSLDDNPQDPPQDPNTVDLVNPSGPHGPSDGQVAGDGQ